MTLSRDGVDLPFVLAFVALFLGIVGIGVSFVVPNPYSRTLPVATVVSAALFLVTRDADRRPSSIDVPQSALLFIYLVVLAAVLVLYQFEGQQRTTAVHALTAAGYTVAALLIFSPASQYLKLAVVILTGVVQRGLAYYSSPLYLGNDVFAHNQNVGEIVSSGSLDPLLNSRYFYAAFYHLLVSVQQLFADVSTRHAAFVTVSVLLVVVPAVSLYLISDRIWGKRVAVLSALLYVASDFALHWAITPQVTGLGIVFFALAFLLLVSYIHTGWEKYHLLYLLAFVAIALTHHVSTVITFLGVLIFLATWTLFEQSFTRKALRVGGISAFIVLVDFSVTRFGGPAGDGGSFLVTVLGIWQSAIREASLPGGSSSELPAGLVLSGSSALTIWHVAGVAILVGLAIFGGLHWIANERTSRKSGMAFGAIVAVLFPLVLVGPVFGLRFLIPWRWFAFIYVPLAILAAPGVIVLVGLASDRFQGLPVDTSTAMAIGMVALLVGPYVFFMGGNSIAARDGPPLDDAPGAERYAVTGPELNTLEHTVSYVPGNVPIIGDFMISNNIFERYYEIENARTITMEDQRPSSIAANESAILVNRSYMQSGHVKFRFGTEEGIGNVQGQLVHGVIPVDEMDPHDQEVIYNSGTTELVRLPASPADGNRSAGNP